ncbi:MAG: hypothetical protein MRJ93_05420 [Nitrososphaeraceae archaeon]|nr:hypothetical protein [Nitrososphaeraceae archaeon]
MYFLLSTNPNYKAKFLDRKIVFRLIFISISILLVFHISNDLDLNIFYPVNTSALEDGEKESIYSSYVFDPSEYFEEDNVPQNNNISDNHNPNRNSNNNNQLTVQQQVEEQQVRQPQVQQEQVQGVKQIKNKKYEFTSIESKNNENNNENNINSGDYVTFQTVINLANIEKTGFIRLVAYINGQSFKEDIPLSELDMSTNKLNVKLNVIKDNGFITLDTPDEFFACAYHVKDLNKEKNSILYFDCNEGDVQSADGTNTIRLFKPSSMVYSDSKALYDQQQQVQGQVQGIGQQDNKKDDKVLLKIISPLADRKNTKELKIAVAIRGQIQTEKINDVQSELDKSKDGSTITRTFTFDRKTDLGNIQIGDRFHACVSSDDLNPPEGQECEKRLVKKFNSPNSLPAR